MINGPGGEAILTDNWREPAARREADVGPETQHAVEPNAPSASDHHYCTSERLRTAYEGRNPVRQVPRLARTRDSAGFARSGSIGSFTLWIETVENLYSRLRETKGVVAVRP